MLLNFFLSTVNKTSPHLYNTRTGNSLDDVPQVKKKNFMAQTHSHYIQFVHGISSKTNTP